LKIKHSLLMPNNPKTLANRLNAQRSTGPKSDRGKLASSQNSRKHGLNVQVDFESSDVYSSLKSLIVEEGYSSFIAADIAASLLNYRRVMDVYYESYSQSEPVDEFIWNMRLKGVHQTFVEMSEGTSITAAENRNLTRIFTRFQRDERRQGGPISRCTLDSHKLIRYQRHAISRLSKAIRLA